MTLQTNHAHFRFLRDLIAIGACFILIAVTVNAEQVSNASPSEAAQKIATSIGTYLGAQKTTPKRPVFDSPVSKRARTVVHQALTSDFEIFDARVNLYYDDDYDGHFYGLEVTFDADTIYAVADVFARLYLSFEGGPWEHYYTTDVFAIFSNSSDDLFSVDTELFTGYPTGSYDVLIELYDADYDDFLAGLGPEDAPDLRNLPLEDQQKDTAYLGPPPHSHSHGGSGGTSVPGIAALCLVALRRNRKTARTRRQNSA